MNEYFNTSDVTFWHITSFTKGDILHYHPRKAFQRTQLSSAHPFLFLLTCYNLILALSDYSIIILWEAEKIAQGSSACMSGPAANLGCRVREGVKAGSALDDSGG